jgi:hypothetical protein
MPDKDGEFKPPRDDASTSTPNPYAFRTECDECHHLTRWPYNPVESAIMDRLESLEEALAHELRAYLDGLHQRLMTLEATVLALQSSREEVQP